MKAFIRCTIGLGLWILSILPAAAEDFPNQVIKLVVPFAAGGGVDVVARIVAPKLAETLGGNVIVEDRGGAGAHAGRVVCCTSDSRWLHLAGRHRQHARDEFKRIHQADLRSGA